MTTFCKPAEMAKITSGDEPRLSETDVQAFADGLLEPHRMARMERYLASRPEEASRVAFYNRLNWQMQTSFQETDDETPVMPESPRPRLRSRRFLQACAATFATLLVFFGAVALASRVPEAALDNASVMALEQAVAVQHERPAENGYATDAASLRAAPDLKPVGLNVVAKRRMRVGLFSHATEYVYWNAFGDAAVLLTTPDPTARAQPQWMARRVGNSRLLVWATGGRRYVLAGRAQTRGLMRAADLMTGH
jgi:anti-sigma factor RsiW